MDESPEALLRSALNLAEVGIELKERCLQAERYLASLRQLFAQASRTIVTLQSTSKYALLQAKQVLTDNPKSSSNDFDKLLNIIETQLADFEDTAPASDAESFTSERIRFLENKYKPYELPGSQSSRSIKGDTDEKYPESWSRGSSIDLNSVVNLPPVPEDVFSAFTTSGGKPKRSASLSSLKGMRKVKLFLQRAEVFDDEEISSDEELGHRGDSDDGSPPKKHLGNITEEL